MLVLTILIPLLFAVIVLVRPPAAAKFWALGGTSVCLLLGAMLVGRFFSNPEPMQAMGMIEWLPALGLSLSVGVDAIAVLLIALALLLGPSAALQKPGAAVARRPRHFQIVSGIHRVRDRIRAEPVRHEDAVITELTAHHLLQRPFVAVHMDAVEPVISGHHRPDACLLDRCLERRQVDLPQRPFIDIG